MTVDLFPWGDFKAVPAAIRPKGNQKTKSLYYYKNIITAFDIETTRIEDIEQSIMYVWQWHFSGIGTVIGRTWDEFNDFTDRLSIELGEQRLCVFVHNLSYEFQFLRGIYNFTADEVFAVKSRKVLKCIMNGNIEYRCSYLHSNMNLDQYLKKMGVEHRKLTGKFDYVKKRYPWTVLDETELAYCTNDVVGLVEAIEIEMAHDGDSLYTFPLTSTGYVRRDAKEAMRQVDRHFIKAQLPDFYIYQMLREAFRGGNTHANRFYANYTIENVHSADRSSSYPDVQCNCKFPVSAFTAIGESDLKTVKDLIMKRRKAVIMRVSFENIRLRRYDWGCPYISRDKCRNIVKATYDNGRILEAEYLETTITDIDFKIILDEYCFDGSSFSDVAYATYGKLPKQLLSTTISYYKGKTEKKGVVGEEIYYMKSKNLLNSVYGMCAQDPVKQDIIFEDGEFKVGTGNPVDILERSNKKAFLSYAWGVWVTAWARWRLEEGIKLAHGDFDDPKAPQFIYCDTDSVKYTGEIDWAKYNEKRKADSIKSGAYATDPQGITHYMGEYEQEHDMTEFRTMGAKKYVFRETVTGPLICTIAGVSKSLGGKELEKAGGISAFKSGFIFHEAGGLEAVYNDFPPMDTYRIDGHELKITANVVLKPSTYTLGLSADYERLLTQIRTDYY